MTGWAPIIRWLGTNLDFAVTTALMMVGLGLIACGVAGLHSWPAAAVVVGVVLLVLAWPRSSAGPSVSSRKAG